MTDSGPAVDPRQTLAALATRFPGAARVFQRHGLDYCCHGEISLRDACAGKQLETGAIVDELQRELLPTPPGERWDERPVPELIDHLLRNYHQFHRAEVPRLLAMAERVEQVHASSSRCPNGLAAHLRFMAGELENHMRKEEQILFPMLRAGHGSHAAGPIQVMESEHQEHGQNLARMRALAGDFSAPAEACATWRSLYVALEQFERDLMQHIHLENHVLFPRVLAT